MFIRTAFAFLCVVAVVFCAGSAKYSYHNENSDPPETEWNTKFEICGNGKRQSPIDLKNPTAKTTGGSFLFNEAFWSKTYEFFFTFNGHTVLSGPTAEDKSNLADDILMAAPGILPGAFYKFFNVHFHWGEQKDSAKGSEHLIEGKQFPLEMHIVWRRADLETTEFTGDGDGAAVTGFVFDIVEESAADSTWDFLKTVKDDYKPRINLSQLMAGDKSQFYRYAGSLTTPGCMEAVQWTVFKLAGLYNFMVGEKKLLNNFRSPQPLNGRTITLYTSKPTSGVANFPNPRSMMKPAKGAAGYLRSGISMLLISLASTLLL